MPEPTLPKTQDHFDSRFRWSRWLQVPIIYVAIFGGIGIVLLQVVQDEADRGVSYGRSLAGAICTLAMAVYGIYFQIRNFPRIHIDGYGITLRTLLGRQECSWPEVAAISLLENPAMRVLWIAMPQPAVQIQRRDGTTLSFWADHYRNTDKLRRVLYGVQQLLHHEANPAYPISLSDAPTEPIQRPRAIPGTAFFKGNWILSFNAIFGFVLLVMAIFPAVAVPGSADGGWMLILLLPLLFLTGLSWMQLYYFELNDKELIVRHHVKWWYRRAYPYEDIVAASQEQPQKRSIGLRITDRWFRTRWYPAGSLRDRTWDALRARLAEHGIRMEE